MPIYDIKAYVFLGNLYSLMLEIVDAAILRLFNNCLAINLFSHGNT